MKNKIRPHQDVLTKIKMMRKKLFESEDAGENKKTRFDQNKEEERMLSFFKDMTVNFDFINIVVENDRVFWGGTIDGAIQFVYKVTPDEKTSGVEFKYLDDFNSADEENQEIIEKVEDYYSIFYKYWRDNLIQ
jgi:hypothetical protein